MSTTLGQQVTLTCERAIAGLVLASQWSLAKAPTGFSVPETSGLSLSFTATHLGEHQFVLRSVSGGVERLSPITVFVDPPPNQAPVLSCPAALESVVGQQVALACTSSDDGLPAGSSMTTQWRVLSVPENVVLAGAQTLGIAFTPSKQGAYQLRLTQSDGELSSTADVVVNVRPPGNLAPTVTCPSTINGITLQDVPMSCSVKDDGLPAGSTLTPLWTLLSQAGPVTLTGKDTSNARMVAAIAGSYRFRFSVSDGELSSQAEVQVNLSLPANRAPVITCPTRVSATLQQPVELNCSATDDGQPASVALSPTWTVGEGPAPVTLSGASSWTSRFTPTAVGNYKLKLNVSDSLLVSTAEVVVEVGYPPKDKPSVNCPLSLSGITGQELSVQCTAIPSGGPPNRTLSYQWTATPALSLATPTTAATRFTASTAGSYNLQLKVIDGEFSNVATVAVKVDLPPNQPPVVTCPNKLAGVRGQAVVLTCSATDDKLPQGSSLSAKWFFESGPEKAFVPAGATSFSANFVPAAVGTYVFRIEVFDTDLVTTKTVSVAVVAPPNLAPTLSCPATVSGQATVAVTATCTATDDGEPEGSTLSHLWAFVSGPTAAPTLTGKTSPTVAFVPSVAGSYVLRLTTSDGQKSTSKDVSFGIGAPPNKAPVVTCPATQNGFTGSDVTVPCSATDDGLPAGSVLSYSWTLLPGSPAANLLDAQTSSVRLRTSNEGSYTLRLAVSDSKATITADVVVSVLNSPNDAPVVNCPASLSGVVGQPLQLSCTATDDGQPAGSSLSLVWSEVSKPGAAGTWTDKTKARSQYVAAVAGSYVLRLAASDGQKTTVANVNVSIAPPANLSPVLTCPGSAKTRINQKLDVTCSATDDGLPSGSKVSFTASWVGASAAASVAIDPSGAVSFTPSSVGSFTLRVTASDSLASSAKDIQVTVEQPLRIQLLGASIINGYGGSQSLRYPFWKKLVDSGVSFDLVGSLKQMDIAPGLSQPVWPDYLGRSFDPDNEGHTGWTTGMIANGLPGLLATYVPDISIIHAGTNNVLNEGASGIDTALTGMTGIVQALRSKNPNVRVYVSQLLPVDPVRLSPVAQTNIDTLNGRLTAWASLLSTTQSPVKVVTLPAGYSAVSDSYDGLHPNASGEVKAGQRLFDAISGDL